jgi:hypothetical protein
MAVSKFCRDPRCPRRIPKAHKERAAAKAAVRFEKKKLRVIAFMV